MAHIIVIDANPLTPIPNGVPNDGAQLPWLGATLAKDYLLNKAQGLPVKGIQPLWERAQSGLPNWWPLNGKMQGE